MRAENTVIAAVAASAVAQALLIPGGVTSHELDAFHKGHVTVQEGEAALEGRGERNVGALQLMLSDAAERNVDTKALLFGQDSSHAVPHRYIVVFADHASEEQMQFHLEVVGAAQEESARALDPGHAFFLATAGENNEFGIRASRKHGGVESLFNVGSELRGYVGYFTDELLSLLRGNPMVAFVEQDSIVSASDLKVEDGAPWGLARISHREKLSAGSFNKYLYDDAGGEGITAYVIDTGINIDHLDFEDRAFWGRTEPDNDADYDGSGHGTHCAGTIGSKTYGVAKKAKLVAVKVLRSNGTGTTSDVLKGIEYAATEAHAEARKKGKAYKGSVANMSLGGSYSQALNMAVDAAVRSGLHMAVAAGNENVNACYSSPASAAGPITVGASTLADDRAYFSNYGRCVDLFAPGMNILSTYIGSDTAVGTLSGTSMAAPHVAGLLTYFLSLQPGDDSQYHGKPISPEALKKKLIAYSTKGVLSNLPAETPNLLVFNGAGESLDEFWKGKASYKHPEDDQSHYSVEDEHLDQQEDFFSTDVASGSRGPWASDSLSYTTDFLYEKVRNVLDNLNII